MWTAHVKVFKVFFHTVLKKRARRPKYLTDEEIQKMLMESDDKESDDNIEFYENNDDSEADPVYIPDDIIDWYRFSDSFPDTRNWVQLRYEQK